MTKEIENGEHPAAGLPPAVLPELIDAGRLATMLSVSARTLYRLKERGYLPEPIRLGGSVRWRLRDVERWIASGCPRN